MKEITKYYYTKIIWACAKAELISLSYLQIWKES